MYISYSFTYYIPRNYLNIDYLKVDEGKPKEKTCMIPNYVIQDNIFFSMILSEILIKLGLKPSP